MIKGGKGADRLFGDGGSDMLHGQNGRDELYGGPGDDELHGGAGNDRLYGGHGFDVLRGKSGSDVLDGDPGDDTCTGGRGYDRFVFKCLQRGDKIITDFDPCCHPDLMVLSGQGFTSVADILAGESEEPEGYFVYTLCSGLTVKNNVSLETGDFVLE